MTLLCWRNGARLRRAMVALVAQMVVALAGCVGPQLEVDAVRNVPPDSAVRSFVLHIGSPDTRADAPAAVLARQPVTTALSSKGFYEAPAGTRVDMIVELDFGVEAPRVERIVHREPIYRTVPAKYREMSSRVVDEKGRSSTVTEMVETKPEQKLFVGSRDEVFTITRFPKFLRITARESTELAGDHPPREIWSVYVTCEDEGRDLDLYLPMLVAAGMDAINAETRGPVRVTVKPGDRRLDFVTKGM